MSGPSAGDYLIGELSDAERAEAERRLREDPGFRAEVERLRPIVESLEELPGEAWSEIPSRPARPARSWRLTPAIAAGAAAVTLLVGIAAGALLDPFEGDEQFEAEESIALSPLDGGGGGEVDIEAGGRTARLAVSDLPASAAGEYYELWLLDGPERLVSLGSFRVPRSGEAEIDVPLPDSPDQYEFLDVSVEATDGDPGHSGRSVLRGPTA